MSKKKHQVARSMSRHFALRLSDAAALMQRKRWAEAREILEELEKRYPNRVEVLTDLVNVNYELKDSRRYQEACERLLKQTPNDPEIILALAGSYLANLRPALALRTFRRFLQRFPDHQRAKEVRSTVTTLEGEMAEWLESGGTSGETGFEIAALHEEAQSLLEQGKYPQARKVEEQVLQLKPDFVAALNNISLTYFADGQLDQALAVSQRVLAIDSENYHALSNLTRYLCLKGRASDARELAERLTAVESNKTDVWTKKAEAYSYLGNDQGMLEAFKGAERAGALRVPSADPLLYHLAAVAEMRLGREAQARRHWEEALKLQPGFDLARDNLDDLKKPVGERHAPWPFGVGNWINQRAIRDLLAQLKPVERKSDKVVTQAARRYLHQHPEFIGLVPLLLDRGDPEGRGFALRLAKMAETPEMIAALRDFALSQRGPDSMRLEAAQIASRAGLITSGSVRMWTHGDWNDTMLLDMEIHDEPTVKHSPRVEEMQGDATVALREGRPEEAEPLLRQALEIEPDAPDLLNNLAVFYEQTGRTLEAEALIRQVAASYPDYAFARISLARMLLLRRQASEAEELLKPLLARKRFNIGEVGAFCAAQVELFLAKGMPDGARSWLDMWAAVDEDNPQIASYRARLRFAGGGLEGTFRKTSLSERYGRLPQEDQAITARVDD